MMNFDILQEDKKTRHIDLFENLGKANQHESQAVAEYMFNIAPLQLGGRAFGLFGLPSVGKRTLIRNLLRHNVANIDIDRKTRSIQIFDGKSCRLINVPYIDDDVSYLSKEHVALWKGLSRRLVLITTAIQEMQNMLHLFDRIGLRYDIIINKFDLVPLAQRQNFKNSIKQQICDAKLCGVDHVWFISALNPNAFSHWPELEHLVVFPLVNVFDTYQHLDLELHP